MRIRNAGSLKPKEISRKGRELLAYVLCGRYGVPAEEIGTASRERGKPYLTEHPEIEFNISHSGDYVVIAFSDRPVGIDVQEMSATSDVDRLAKHVMTPKEYAHFQEEEDRETAFYRLWVRKEAYIKRTGDGLYLDLRTLPEEGWYEEIAIAPQYACAICAEEPLNVTVEEITE